MGSYPEVIHIRDFFLLASLYLLSAGRYETESVSPKLHAVFRDVQDAVRRFVVVRGSCMDYIMGMQGAWLKIYLFVKVIVDKRMLWYGHLWRASKSYSGLMGISNLRGVCAIIKEQGPE